jgi:hypothetical protein
MSYRTQAIMAADDKLMLRIAACAATQGVKDPRRWAGTRNWEFSSEPGWDAAYAYAINAAVADPGNDEGCITDGMILASVALMLSEETS